MLAGRQTTLGIPNEEGETITLRSLGHRVLRDARDAHLKTVTATVADLDLSKVMQAIKDGNLDEEVTAATGAPTPDASGDYSYDQDIVLRHGIVAWTYEDAVTPEAIEQLDPDTADWAFRQIIDLSRRNASERKG